MRRTWSSTLDAYQERRRNTFGMDMRSMQKGVVEVKPTCENRSLKTTAKCRAKCCRSNRSQQRRDVTASMGKNTRQFQLGLTGIGDYCEMGCCDYSRPESNMCRRNEIKD